MEDDSVGYIVFKMLHAEGPTPADNVVLNVHQVKKRTNVYDTSFGGTGPTISGDG